MRTLRLNARNVRPRDIVTGVWSDAGQRWDPVVHFVKDVDYEITPDNVEVVTICGARPYERSTYCADTVLRVVVP